MDFLIFKIDLIPDQIALLQAMKAFIDANFKLMDINSDGVLGLEEFRYNCITRIAVDDIQVIDDAYNHLLSVSLSGVSCVAFAQNSRDFYVFSKYRKKTKKPVA